MWVPSRGFIRPIIVSCIPFIALATKEDTGVTDREPYITSTKVVISNDRANKKLLSVWVFTAPLSEHFRYVHKN